MFSGEEPPCSGAIYVLSESFREDYCMESYSYSLLQPGCVGLHVDYNPPAMLTTDLAPPPRSRSHCALSLMLNELGAAGLNTSDAERRSLPFISAHSRNRTAGVWCVFLGGGSRVPNGDLFVELRCKCTLPRWLPAWLKAGGACTCTLMHLPVGRVTVKPPLLELAAVGSARMAPELGAGPGPSWWGPR